MIKHEANVLHVKCHHNKNTPLGDRRRRLGSPRAIKSDITRGHSINVMIELETEEAFQNRTHAAGQGFFFFYKYYFTTLACTFM